MKGFKPTGYGPSAGFKYPTKFGFTGSTGVYSNVSPHVRRKHFANGGFVREDNPRMKEASIGDQGSPLVRRARSYTQADQESGGKGPLRPGYKKGGKTKVKKPLRKADGGGVRSSAYKTIKSQYDSTTDAGNPITPRTALGQRMLAGMQGDRIRSRGKMKEWLDAQEGLPARDMGHGPIKRADGGTVDRSYRVPRRSGAYTLGQGIAAFPKLIGMVPGALKDAAKGVMTRAQTDVADSKRRRIDRITDGGDLASNYSRGGKTRRMGYAKGGGVSKGEAKKIAQRTVGEHVRYPAPKGHKGLEKVVAQRR